MLNSQRTAFTCLPSAGIKRVYHQVQLQPKVLRRFLTWLGTELSGPGISSNPESSLLWVDVAAIEMQIQINAEWFFPPLILKDGSKTQPEDFIFLKISQLSEKSTSNTRTEFNLQNLGVVVYACYVLGVWTQVGPGGSLGSQT